MAEDDDHDHPYGQAADHIRVMVCPHGTFFFVLCDEHDHAFAYAPFPIGDVPNVIEMMTDEVEAFIERRAH